MADDQTKPITPLSTPAATPPVNPGQYIRTYAKDVARLKGTQPVAPAPAPQKKQSADTGGVVMPDVDESQRQGIGTAATAPQGFSAAPIDISATSGLSSQDFVRPTAAREERREEILSRLREKANIPLPPPPPPPAPAPAPMQVPAPAPVPSPVAPPVPPAPIVAPPAPAIPVPPPVPAQAFPFHPSTPPVPPPPSSPTQAPEPVPENLHTFSSDFSAHIDQQHASTFSVLAAQSDARGRADTPKPATITAKKKPNVALIAAAIVFVLLGVGGLGGAYWYFSSHTSVPKPFEIQSLVFADEKVELSSDIFPIAALAELAQQPSVKGNVIVAYTTSSTKGKSGIIKAPQQSGPVIREILHSAPDILLRNIDDTSTVGVANAGDTAAPFFILRATSYDRTLAGMLGWEPTISTDLAQLYPAPASTGTTTPTARMVETPRFVDEVITNHNARALKDPSGTTILLYGYSDKRTLIIARNEAAFTLLIERINAAGG